jgi:drug/metabolite transporter (DMT)-like permease
MTSSPYVPCYETAANGIRGERTRLRRWPIGIVFLGEPAAAHLLIGTGIVLVGIALVQRRTPAPVS